MRYLFVIQGEGRGHMTQALSLANILRRNDHTVSEVLVGECSNRKLPQFFLDKIGCPVVRYASPTLDYGKDGKKMKLMRTIVQNTSPVMAHKWHKSIHQIAKRIKEVQPDVVINFYEPLMGAVSMFHFLKPPVVSIANQFLMVHSDFNLLDNYQQGSWVFSVMNRFCALGSKKILALSLFELEPQKEQKIVVVPPLIRSEIFDLEIKQGDFMLGYMLNPSYLDEIVEWKKANPEAKIHLFWDKEGEPEEQEYVPGLWLHRINDRLFIELMASSAGYITTAGFDSICEAGFLGKPTVMIPLHVEQEINAQVAEKLGIGAISREFDVKRLNDYIAVHNNKEWEKFRKWVLSAEERILKEITQI